jgi:hypothetical protein
MKQLLKLANSLARHLLTQSQYESLIDFRDDLSMVISRDYWRRLEQVRQLKDKHQGERCFIIGNGPSLNRTDLPRLAEEYTFGLNRIYLLFGKMGFVPSYYVCTNLHVIEQSWQEIRSIPHCKFIGRAGIPYMSDLDNTIFLRSLSRPRFSYDIARGVWEGATVTYCAMQIAYYMGFTEVILVGVDHYFATKGEPHKLVISSGDDPNHFDPNYFGKGVNWQLPDLQMSELAYEMAKVTFEKAGRRILDATIDGHLQIFPKVSFEEIVVAQTR